MPIVASLLMAVLLAAAHVLLMSSAPAEAAAGTATVTPAKTPSPLPTRTPAPTATPKPPASVRLPVLMYHYISKPPAKADRYRIDLSVAPEAFEQQLIYLRDNGFTTVSLQDVYDLLSMGKRLPPKPIVLTFDDGYLDHYTNAFRLLKKYKMTGTFFVVTDYVVYKNPEHLTWAMIKEMAKAGMSIESHSRTHKDMRGRKNDFLVWEILGPVEQIEAYADKRPRFFCYPTGKYDAAVMKILRDVGTLAAVTTEYGDTYTLQNAMTWPRHRVRHDTTVAQFASLVELK